MHVKLILAIILYAPIIYNSAVTSFRANAILDKIYSFAKFSDFVATC